MADQTEKKSSFMDDFKTEFAGKLGFEQKKTSDPLDKTTSQTRMVKVGDRWVLRNPLGVEPDYAAPYTGQRMTPEEDAWKAFGWDGSTGISARYDASDLDLFAGLSPESLATIQADLARAGLLKEYPKGIFTTETGLAVGKILTYANQRGLLWQDALYEWAQAGDEAGLNKGPKGPTFTARLSNPDDLRKVFKQVAYNTMGGNFLADEDYERMVEQYQGAELAAQRRAFDVAVGGGGETVEQPQAQTFAQDTMQDEQTVGVQAHSIMKYGQVLESLLGGS